MLLLRDQEPVRIPIPTDLVPGLTPTLYRRPICAPAIGEIQPSCKNASKVRAGISFAIAGVSGSDLLSVAAFLMTQGDQVLPSFTL